jgi:hypothetical protein
MARAGPLTRPSAGLVDASRLVASDPNEWLERDLERTASDGYLSWYLIATVTRDQPPPQRMASMGDRREARMAG